jgi:type IV pilus assembly protein PilQ
MSSMLKHVVVACAFIFAGMPTVMAGPSAPELFIPDEGVTISMDLQDAQLKDVLKLFSIQSGLNFIANEGIQERQITLYLDKVPLRDAMDKLFSANNLSYELMKDSNIIVVKDWGKPQIETVTKVFTLKNATVSSSSLKEEMASQMKDFVKIASDVGGAETEDTEEGSSGKWKSVERSGITEVITQMLSESGSVIEDFRTNSLIVTDIPSHMEKIELVISQLDVPLSQILLEVEVLDVSKTELEKKGLKFGDITSLEGLLSAGVTFASRQTYFPLHGFTGDARAKSAVTPGSFHFYGDNGTGSKTVLLDFLQQLASTKIIARPKIVTLNNEPAEIRALVSEVIGEKTTIDDTGNVETTAERTVTGLSLRVVPQVNIETGDITMFVAPKIIEANPSTLFPSSYRDPEGRETKSMVRIKDGETVIVGGLIKHVTSVTTDEVPVVSKIPLVGRLFRHKNKDRGLERELLVFITPRIVKDVGYSGATAASKSVKIQAPQREQNAANGMDRQRIIASSLTGFETN